MKTEAKWCFCFPKQAGFLQNITFWAQKTFSKPFDVFAAAAPKVLVPFFTPPLPPLTLQPFIFWRNCAHVACLFLRSSGSRLLCLTSIGLACVITFNSPLIVWLLQPRRSSSLVPLIAACRCQTSNQYQDQLNVTLQRPQRVPLFW